MRARTGGSPTAGKMTVHVVGLVILVVVVFASDEKPELIRGRRGGQQLIYKNYCYTSHKCRLKTKRWECVDRGCRALLTTSLDGQEVLKYTLNTIMYLTKI